MDIVARDVAGTAHVGAHLATTKMEKWLSREVAPTMEEIDSVKELLVMALSDVYLMRHMMEPNWRESTYHPVWNRSKDTNDDG